MWFCMFKTCLRHVESAFCKSDRYFFTLAHPRCHEHGHALRSSPQWKLFCATVLLSLWMYWSFFLPLQDSRTSLCLVLVLSFFVSSSHLEVSSSFAFLSSPRVFSSFRKLVFWGFLCHAPFCLFCPRPFQQRHFLQDHALGAKSCRSSGQRLQIINNMP